MKKTHVASILSLSALTHARVANVVRTELVANNGVIHVTDSVVMPK